MTLATPNATIHQVFDHLGRCSAALIGAIFDEIAKHGANRASTPIATSYHDGLWWIYIEADTADRTFEIEVSHADHYTALANALTRTRREFSS